ncbi:MAG: FG-GAP repeat domain-containing protein, partial [Limisphaerales bacterium]
RFAGTADFNGSGQVDFLFQNQDGRVAAWLMDGITRTNSILFPASPPTQRLIGAGDFNYNIQPDLLFQRPDGQLRVWIMNSAHQRVSIQSLQHLNPAWRAITVADFNKDGSADIFFQNPNTGHIAIWIMNGLVRQDFIVLDPTSWRLAAVRDINNDGHSDLIFQKGGKSAAWLMNGTNRTSVVYFREGISVADTWTLVGAR